MTYQDKYRKQLNCVCVCVCVCVRVPWYINKFISAKDSKLETETVL